MGSGYDINKAMNTFFIESREMCDTVESCLLKLEKDPGHPEWINSLFRAIHTIKGASGMFQFREIERFTHRVENLLDDVRNSKFNLDDDIISILLECHDHVSGLLDLYENNHEIEPDEELIASGNMILDKLKAYFSPSGTEQAEKSGPAAGAGAEAAPEGDSVSSDFWHVSLRLGTNIFTNGLDPQSFISYLGDKAEIVNIITIADKIPPVDRYDPEKCYLGFEMLVDGIKTKTELEDVFEFMKDDCEIKILSPGSSITEYVSLIEELDEDPMQLGEILIKAGCLTKDELKIALEMQEKDRGGEEEEKQPLIGEIMVEEKMVHKPILDAALNKQKEISKAEERKNKSLRIDSDRIDELINIIGELVITGANICQVAEQTENPDLIQPVLTMSRLVEDVRDRIMNIRMVQIGETFKRFERVIRDLSRQSGKEVDLIINGGETELDKSITEKISDPIMHLIRNSLDHGIDMPDERVAKGKPARGYISLDAYNETGNIVIEIKDDGNGLNREKIFNKAVAQGLLQPDQQIEDYELFQYIFEPGFSTADKITNISGRGVGMDVVKKNIESLRGTVVLESEEGAGMTTRIHLPLTLAIIDGFLVQVAESFYVVPLNMVSEVFEVSSDELMQKEGANIINLRNEVLPFMRLRDFFEEPHEETSTENVIVVEYARKKTGLVVDNLVGEFQTVIKSIGKLYSELDWVSGATILGSGDVALILDVPRLIQLGEKVSV